MQRACKHTHTHTHTRTRTRTRTHRNKQEVEGPDWTDARTLNCPFWTTKRGKMFTFGNRCRLLPSGSQVTEVVHLKATVYEYFQLI